MVKHCDWAYSHTSQSFAELLAHGRAALAMPKFLHREAYKAPCDHGIMYSTFHNAVWLIIHSNLTYVGSVHDDGVVVKTLFLQSFYQISRSVVKMSHHSCNGRNQFILTVTTLRVLSGSIYRLLLFHLLNVA